MPDADNGLTGAFQALGVKRNARMRPHVPEDAEKVVLRLKGPERIGAGINARRVAVWNLCRTCPRTHLPPA
jgi:hypothetical protein